MKLRPSSRIQEHIKFDFCFKVRSQHSLRVRAEDLLAKPSQDILCDWGQTAKTGCFSCWISKAEVAAAVAFKPQTAFIVIGWLNSTYLFVYMGNPFILHKL